ncbi:hypothetical protein LB505_001304 [Fusarium chuoi]|nr:hypothetical protein LB505_001304 [Fusarium chuoi]KAI1032179.1 hypothetical protein LB503_010861 [Fusarium chuoi]
MRSKQDQSKDGSSPIEREARYWSDDRCQRVTRQRPDTWDRRNCKAEKTKEEGWGVDSRGEEKRDKDVRSV